MRHYYLYLPVEFKGGESIMTAIRILIEHRYDLLRGRLDNKARGFTGNEWEAPSFVGMRASIRRSLQMKKARNRLGARAFFHLKSAVRINRFLAHKPDLQAPIVAITIF